MHFSRLLFNLLFLSCAAISGILKKNQKQHVDIFNDTWIGCFVYFQNVMGWTFPNLVISQLWKKYENVLGKFKMFYLTKSSSNVWVNDDLELPQSALPCINVIKLSHIPLLFFSHWNDFLQKNCKYNWSFSFQNPPSRVFIFATRNLWNYSMQVFSYFYFHLFNFDINYI